MKKLFAFTISVMLIFMGLIGCGTTSDLKPIKVAIIQKAEHPALDAARQGFLDSLKASGYVEGKNLTVDYKNAQNDMSTLNSIAQKFASDKPDLILAVGTSSAQAMAAATKDIPILITAVTDPVTANLVDSMDKPGTNVTGTTDMNPIQDQFDLLKKLVPDTKAVGIIYDASEVNSQVQVALVKKIAATMGLTIKEATVTSTADVMTAAQSLIGSVQVVYIPTDNTVVSAAQAVLKETDKNKIPVISGESSVVDMGGLGTIGINYGYLGKQTGDMALKILKGSKPQDMPIESQKNFDIVINKDSVATLGIQIPADIASKATMVQTKK